MTNRPLAAGVYAALVTPRRPNSIEADTGVLLDYLDAIVQAGVEGLVLFGATGEFVHFDIEERIRVSALAIKRSRVPVLVNVSHSTLAGALELGEKAVDSGASGLLLMPPYFYRYPDEQICEFYDQFIKILDEKIPVYLYNLPDFTNPLSLENLRRLLSTGAFAGIKDSGGGSAIFEELQPLRAAHPFQFLVGRDSLYMSALQAGASGIVSGVAAAVPELIVALDRAIRGGDHARAGRLNEKLSEFMVYVDKFPATVAIKQAAVARGWTSSHVAVPLDEDMAAEVIAFHIWFHDWLQGVLAECKQSSTAPAF
ncbi:MAG: dihydrodipicolinate synthase family protein [Acidobacteriaceae bacterium]|nr:dihydrodipicolinate synthase family protein [Acidobacteriaceae bacterium]MBV8569583.1 dihydrodipicolinate synthase family protein [Acidobacteriaceae bacterium]